MRFESRTFCVAKDLEYPDQYQDAFDLNAEQGVAAIADGVKLGFFPAPGPAARAARPSLPARSFQSRLHPILAGRLRAPMGSTNRSRASSLGTSVQSLPNGAMTTLLWLTLSPMEDGSAADGYCLRAFAVGDCCLFHVRDGLVLRSFPMKDSGAFGLNPRRRWQH